jgi:hypothetical protein
MLRFVFGLLICLGLCCAALLADTPGEEAVKDAIKTLKAKRAAVKDKADQALLDTAIKDLEERLAQVGKGDPEPAEKKAEPFVMPKGWELKFNTGRNRPTYDPKTGELKTTYDFTDIKQLKDFAFSDELKPTVKNGFLTVKGGDEMKHVVRFRTISVSATVVLGAATSVFDTSKNDNGQQYYLWAEPVRGHTDLVTGVVVRPRFPIFHTVKEYPRNVIGNGVPITIKDWFVNETKSGLKVGDIDVSWKRPTDGIAGHLVLNPGTAPNQYAKLVISGRIDTEWAKEFFADLK